jgi:hypothetical protein
MKSFVATLLLLLLVACTQAFTVQPLAVRSVVASSSTNLNMVFGNKKSKAKADAEASKYWEGEWVCKDCGYIYNRVSYSRVVSFTCVCRVYVADYNHCALL